MAVAVVACLQHRSSWVEPARNEPSRTLSSSDSSLPMAGENHRCFRDLEVAVDFDSGSFLLVPVLSMTVLPMTLLDCSMLLIGSCLLPIEAFLWSLLATMLCSLVHIGFISYLH